MRDEKVVSNVCKVKVTNLLPSQLSSPPGYVGEVGGGLRFQGWSL